LAEPCRRALLIGVALQLAFGEALAVGGKQQSHAPLKTGGFRIWQAPRP
jgi:hypothetical protein